MKKETVVLNLQEHLKTKARISDYDHLFIRPEPLSKTQFVQKRIYSFLVDIITICIINTAVNIAFALFINSTFLLSTPTEKFNIINTNFIVMASVFMIIFSSYFFYSHYVLNGQTIGKMIFKIRTVQTQFMIDKKHEQYAPTWLQSIQRSLGYLMCYLSFGSLFVISMVSVDNKGVPDQVSSTETVDEEWLKWELARREQDNLKLNIKIEALSLAV